IYFGENQISLSLISLSLRPTGHPPTFQPRSVRSSTGAYPRFNLPMGSSLSFGSTAYDSNRPIRTRFRFGSAHRLTLPQTSNSPARYAKSTPSHSEECSDRLYALCFRYYFTPLPVCFSPSPHCTSPLSVTREYLALEGGPPRFSPRFTGADLLRYLIGRLARFRLRDDCPLWCTVPRASSIDQLCNSRSETHF